MKQYPHDSSWQK